MAGFQIGAAAATGLFRAVGPQGAAAMRLALGAAMLAILSRPWRNWPVQPPLLTLAALGAVTAGAILCFYQAIARVPQGLCVALQFLGPLAVAVAGSRRPRDLLWAAAAGAGVWALLEGHPTAGRIDPVGVAFALGAAVCWGSYILLGRRIGAAFGGAGATLAVGVAAIFTLPFGVGSAGTRLFDPALALLALAVAAISTALPFSLEFYALPRMPARTASVLFALEPAMGVLSGFFLLGQRLSGLQVAGVALVIAAAAGAAGWQAPRAEAEPLPPD